MDLAGIRDALTRSSRRRTLAAAMALSLGAGLLGGWGISESREREHHLTYGDVEPSLVPASKGEVLPTRGELQDDKELLRAATRAFLLHRGSARKFDARARSNRLDSGPGGVDVLFAGALGAKKVPTVLLQGSVGARPVLFRYEEREDERPDKVPATRVPYEVESLPRRVELGGAPLVLNPFGNGSAQRTRKSLRLLVPEGMTKLRVAGFGGKSYDWRPVTVKDGVTEPLRTHDPSFTSLSLENEQHSIGGCHDRGLLLRATLELARGDSTEAFYIVRGRDFYAVRAGLRTSPDLFDAPYVRTLARSLMCDNGPVKADERVAAVSWERVWTGKSADGDGRQEIVRLMTESATRKLSISKLLVGVDEPRHLAYFSRAQDSRTGDTSLDGRYGVCAAWDDRVVVAGGNRVTRIEVTELGSGETYTADGDSLVARRKDGGGDRGFLTAAVTRTKRSKGGREAPYTGVVRCLHAPDTPDF